MEKPTDQGSSTCPQCGRPLAPQASFCRHCGTRRGVAAPSPPLLTADPEGSNRRGPGKIVALAIAVGLIVGGGVAAGILLLGDEGSSPAADAPAATATVPATEAAATAEGEASSSPSSSGLPSDDKGQMAQEIEDVLLAFHEDLVTERFRDAWSLLSQRKRSQTLREDGYSKWKQAQASLAAYLLPWGLTAHIEGIEGGGVARVRITGMAWTAPGSSCSEWSGLTWAKYEAGTWTYDPGYSTTPEREREWKNRYAELLGATC